MKDIEFGIKVWSNNGEFLRDSWKSLEKCGFSYAEVTAIPETKIGIFAGTEINYIIHVAHDSFGSNIGDRKCLKKTEECMAVALEWADKLDAKYIILHPGFGKMEDAVEYLLHENDKRILLENMPKMGLDGESMIGYSPGQLRKLMGKKFGLCVDFGHAIKGAKSLETDYKKFTEELMKLKPAVFHLSDGTVEKEIDDHLSIGSGNFDMKFIKKCIEKNGGMVTLEIPYKKGGAEYFCENLNRFKCQD